MNGSRYISLFTSGIGEKPATGRRGIPGFRAFSLGFRVSVPASTPSYLTAKGVGFRAELDRSILSCSDTPLEGYTLEVNGGMAKWNIR